MYFVYFRDSQIKDNRKYWKSLETLEDKSTQTFPRNLDLLRLTVSLKGRDLTQLHDCSGCTGNICCCQGR